MPASTRTLLSQVFDGTPFTATARFTLTWKRTARPLVAAPTRVPLSVKPGGLASRAQVGGERGGMATPHTTFAQAWAFDGFRAARGGAGVGQSPRGSR